MTIYNVVMYENWTKLKAFESAFAYKKKDDCCSTISRFLCIIPIIGGFAGIILSLNHGMNGKHYAMEIKAQLTLDYGDPDDVEAQQTLIKATAIGNAFFVQTIIGFTPLSIFLLPVQIIATIERMYRKSKLPAKN